MDENSSTSFGRLKVENVVGGVEGGVCVREGMGWIAK